MWVGLNIVVRTSNLMIYSLHIHRYMIKFINNLFQVHGHYMLAVYDISWKNATSVNIRRWVWKQFYSKHIEVSSFPSLTTKWKLKCAIILLHFHVVPTTSEAFITSWDRLFCSLLISVRVLCYQPSRYNCHLAIIFQFAAAMISSSARGMDGNRWATNSPDIITISVSFLSSKLYTIWTYFLTNPRNT